MDREDLSETIIQEVSAIVAEDVRAAGPELLTADLDGMEARLQAVSRRVCGATLERVLAVRAAPRGERPPCPVCGGLLRLVAQARGRNLQGLTGDATMVRPTYVCTWAGCGQGHAPLDAELGLGAETLTPRLARVVCRAGITGAFDAAAAQGAEDHGVVVGGETARGVTEAVGAVAEAAQQDEVARARRGALTRPVGGARDMVVAVDGCQAPLRDGWHEVKVGRAAPLGPATRTDRRSGRTYLAWGTAAICAGLEGAEDCWWRVAVTAWRAGLGQQTRRVVVLGDGAEWIWARAAHVLGGPGVAVVEVLDIFHAYEHLWDAGRAAFATPEALAAWATPLEDALYEEGASAVLDALDALAARPLELAAAEALRRARAYVADNAACLDYPRFVAQQLPIGSGAVESLCKTLNRGAREGGRDALDAGGAASGGHAARRARLGRRGCLLGGPPAARAPAPAPVPPGPPAPPRPRRRSHPGNAARCPAPAPAPEAPAQPPAPPESPPAPAPAVTADPTTPARRPAASHVWRHASIGRARCA